MTRPTRKLDIATPRTQDPQKLATLDGNRVFTSKDSSTNVQIHGKKTLEDGAPGIVENSKTGTISDTVPFRVPTHSSGRRISSTSFEPLMNFYESPRSNKELTHDPLPHSWESAHDRVLCMLDARGHSLPTIERKIKRGFPDLDNSSLNVGILDRRLRWLDYWYTVPYWKEGLGMKLDGSCGLETDREVEEMEAEKEVLAAAQTIKRISEMPTVQNAKRVSIFKRKGKTSESEPGN